MLRFTDTRLLKWKISDAAKYEYIPVMGAGENIYIKRTPVTNAEYAEFAAEEGITDQSNGTYSEGEENYPVNFVLYEEAEAYCEWLTKKDGVNTYRLPSESEWELAAGHMPKDADFNCGINDGRTPVEQYAATRGAHGAIDFWGNVWEWTSTAKDDSGDMAVKGGSWNSDRTDCRTEYRGESRAASEGYDDVGFRVIQVLNKTETEQRINIFVNGIGIDYKKYGNVRPVIENGRTLAPVRAVAEALGAEVAWDSQTREITISKDDIFVRMAVGENVAYVNGTQIQLDAAPQIINDRTLVPVRFIAESFNLTVDWDGNGIMINTAAQM